MVETLPHKKAELSRARDQLGHLAWILDDMFKIPGLNWRFGLDALIGLIPGAGDLVGAGLSLLLLARALQFRLPPVIILRMVINGLIDILVGSIPVAGDVFDFVWKSNAMNMKLFERYATEPEQSTARHWIFLALIALLFGGALLLVSFGIYYALRKVWTFN